ncbi:hypothetical protein JZ751_025726 [Albula glossodonta]|uniref:Sushi domain-containing protein n=1 Tax=Albula glossodonta TaxID=121402 RepID=A0A8T2NLH7_9TELE|nr:hypothetical protein JZ751_025726 [Albula glossodonta]
MRDFKGAFKCANPENLCKSQYLDMNNAPLNDSLQVGFTRPGVAASVIIYLSSDGAWPGEQCRRAVTIQLSDTTGTNHSLGTYELSCQRNPLVVNVTHNLSLPFFLTAAHGTVTCDPRPGTPHCTVRCHQGYTLSVLSGKGLPPNQRETELDCVHGAWDRVLTCQPIDCGFPDQSHIYFATFSCSDGTTFGRKCTFTCNPPAKLQGRAGGPAPWFPLRKQENGIRLEDADSRRLEITEVEETRERERFLNGLSFFPEGHALAPHPAKRTFSLNPTMLSRILIFPFPVFFVSFFLSLSAHWRSVGLNIIAIVSLCCIVVTENYVKLPLPFASCVAFCEIQNSFRPEWRVQACIV